MVKRFVERFQLWRQQRADEFEDKFLAGLLFFAAVIIGHDVYTLITKHQLTWSAFLWNGLILAFIVLYIRRSRWAWLPLMMVALAVVVSLPVAYMHTHASTHARIVSTLFVLAFAGANLIYSLKIRKRFARGNDTI